MSTNSDSAIGPLPREEYNPVIDFETLQKVDIRVGLITKAERVPKSSKLLKLEVFLGHELRYRTVVAGIAETYDPDLLVTDKVHVVVVTNLEPKKLMGVESHGMVLAGPMFDGRPRLVACPGCEPGTRIG